MTKIEDYTFWNCYWLESVSLPHSVTYIGDSAFSDCEHLKNMEISANVTHIGEWAFSYRRNLAGIWVDYQNPNYSSDLSGVLFDKAKTILFSAPGGLTGSYSIPSTVTRLESSAFAFCDNLTGITIPSSVKTPEAEAFWSCTKVVPI